MRVGLAGFVGKGSGEVPGNTVHPYPPRHSRLVSYDVLREVSHSFGVGHGFETSLLTCETPAFGEQLLHRYLSLQGYSEAGLSRSLDGP